MARIEHFALFTRDLEGLREFYEAAFGMRVVCDNSKAPIAGYFLADDRGSVLEIVARPHDVHAVETRHCCHVAFWVDDFEAARDALENTGISFEPDTEVHTPTTRTAFFRDPDGNRLQIIWRQHPLVPTPL